MTGLFQLGVARGNGAALRRQGTVGIAGSREGVINDPSHSPSPPPEADTGAFHPNRGRLQRDVSLGILGPAFLLLLLLLFLVKLDLHTFA